MAEAGFATGLKVAKANGALLMLPGDVYNFGQDLPAEPHVATPQIGCHDKARIRIAMEQQLQAAAEEGGFWCYWAIHCGELNPV